MDDLKVTVTGPIIRRSDGVLLKVSAPAFAKNPRKVYTLPRTGFWMQLVYAGYIKEVNPVVEPEKVEGEKEAPKPPQAKVANHNPARK